MLLDTYETFGCKSGIPTFRYSLIDGVKDGYLVSPTVIDARSQVTTQLLSDQGYAYVEPTSQGEDTSLTLKRKILKTLLFPQYQCHSLQGFHGKRDV